MCCVTCRARIHLPECFAELIICLYVRTGFWRGQLGTPDVQIDVRCVSFSFWKCWNLGMQVSELACLAFLIARFVCVCIYCLMVWNKVRLLSLNVSHTSLFHIRITDIVRWLCWRELPIAHGQLRGFCHCFMKQLIVHIARRSCMNCTWIRTGCSCLVVRAFRHTCDNRLPELHFYKNMEPVRKHSWEQS